MNAPACSFRQETIQCASCSETFLGRVTGHAKLSTVQFLNKRIPFSIVIGRSGRHSMEDERRKRVSLNGRVEAICTLHEVEGKPYVRAVDEYVVTSTLSGQERRITVCSEHADKLDKGNLPYRVIRRRKGI